MALERQRKSGPTVRWRVDTRWLAVSAASRMSGLSRQVRTLRLLSSVEDLELATCYAVGALFGGSCPPAAQLEQVSDDAVCDVRYLDVLPLPAGGYRIWYEARLPDESHELRTELVSP